MTTYSADLVPTMVGDTNPSGTCSASTVLAGNEAYRAFADDNATTKWLSTASSPQWLQYQFPTGKVIAKYRLMGRGGGNWNPTAWNFQGSNNGSSWNTLDSQTGQALGVGTWHDYAFTNVTSYTYYRLSITADDGGGRVGVGEMELQQITSVPITITGTLTDGEGLVHAGLTVNLTGGTTASTTTDGSGAYTFNVDSGANYTVTPAAVNGWIFSPISISFTAPDSNQVANFTCYFRSPLKKLTSGLRKIIGFTEEVRAYAARIIQNLTVHGNVTVSGSIVNNNNEILKIIGANVSPLERITIRDRFYTNNDSEILKLIYNNVSPYERITIRDKAAATGATDGEIMKWILGG